MTSLFGLFMKDLCIHLPMTLTRHICSNHACFLKSAGRNPPIADFLKSATARFTEISPPPVCRFPQICHCRFPEICWQKSPPVCRFTQICHCRFTEICGQKSPPPSLQISSNLPLQIYCNSPLVCRLLQI